MVKFEKIECDHPEDSKKDYHDSSIICTKCHEVIEQFGEPTGNIGYYMKEVKPKSTKEEFKVDDEIVHIKHGKGKIRKVSDYGIHCVMHDGMFLVGHFKPTHHNQAPISEFKKVEDKQLVYVLESGGINAVHLDLDNLCDGLKMELDNMHPEDALEMKFTLTAKIMTGEEIDALPEFDGF